MPDRANLEAGEDQKRCQDHHRSRTTLDEFTFYSYTGQSTVDYVVTNLCDFTTMTYFEVQDFNEYFDHVPILFKLHTKSCDNTHMQQETQTPNITCKIVWDKNKVAYFKE